MLSSSNNPQENLTTVNEATMNDDVQADSARSDTTTMPNDIIAMVVDELLAPLLHKNEIGAEISLRRSILRQWIRGYQTFLNGDGRLASRKHDISLLITPLSTRESGDLLQTLINLAKTNQFARYWLERKLWENERIHFQIPDDYFVDDCDRGQLRGKIWLKVMMNDSVVVPERFVTLIRHLELEVRTCGALLQQSRDRYLKRRFLFGTPKLRSLETLTFRFFGDVSIAELIQLKEHLAAPVAFRELVNAESVKTVRFVRHFGIARPSLAGIQAYWPDHPAFGKEKSYFELGSTLEDYHLPYGPGVQGPQGATDRSTMPKAEESSAQAAHIEEFDRQILLHWAGSGSSIEHTLEEKKVDAAEIPARKGVVEKFGDVPAHKGDFTFLTSTLIITKPDAYQALPKHECPLYQFVAFYRTVNKRADIAAFGGNRVLMERIWSKDRH